MRKFARLGKHKVHLLLVVPNKRSGPAPVFVGLNFAGNHAALRDPAIRLPTSWMYDNRKGVKNNRAGEEGRGSENDTWAVEQTIDRGFAVALVDQLRRHDQAVHRCGND